jgi:hypothetical protein
MNEVISDVISSRRDQDRVQVHGDGVGWGGTEGLEAIPEGLVVTDWSH